MKKLGLVLRYLICIILCTLIIGAYFSPQMQSVRNLPEAFYLQEGQSHTVDISSDFLSIKGDSAQVRASSDETIYGKNATIDGIAVGDSTLMVKVFGMPLKTVELKIGSLRAVIPGGHSIGVTLHTQGVLVVGTGDVVSPDGSVSNPAKDAGIHTGDIIRSVNGVEIGGSSNLGELINKSSEGVSLGVLSEGVLRDVKACPREDILDNKFKLGLWVRDSTAGVGTLTFYDPSTRQFGALGHAITDIDTRSRLLIRQGEILNAVILDVQQAISGIPGELKGSFSSKDAIGSITSNTEYGIFGETYNTMNNPIYPDGVKVAQQNEVHMGKAEILSTIDSTGIQSFACEIIRLQPQNSPAQRGMVLQITDERLLSKTGGIVQGMSGSPIMQDGKLIGAVTHVFLNDPKKGYGMFIEWMLYQIK